MVRIVNTRDLGAVSGVDLYDASLDGIVFDAETVAREKAQQAEYVPVAWMRPSKPSTPFRSGSKAFVVSKGKKRKGASS